MADSLIESLESRGLTRRAFLAFCGSVAAAIGVEGVTGAKVAEALEDNALIGANGGLGNKALAPVIWMELGSCTGCTESFAQVDDPDPATLLLEYLALNYSETLSAAAGYSLEEAREQTIKSAAGKYVFVVEGAVMTGWDGDALRIAGERTCAAGDSPLITTAKNAAVVIAAGSCAVDGGVVAAWPNPAGAEGIQKYLKDNGVTTPVVNVPSCPVNCTTLVAIIVQYLLLGVDSIVNDLNSLNMMNTHYGETIHDNCQRRGHFENGEFVYEFGSEEEAKGYCLYPMGCKGPTTKASCSITRWNRRASWCVDAGAPCIGCVNADPRVSRRNWVDVDAPFLGRLKKIRIGKHFFEPTSVAVTVSAVIGAALVIHGFGMKAAGRTKGGAPFEKERAWDAKHKAAAAVAAPASDSAAAEKEPVEDQAKGE